MKSKSIKSDYIQVRIQESVKKEVELIFDELGVSTSQAINIFFKQVIQKNGLPFNMTLDYNPALLTDEDINDIKQAKLEIKEGKGIKINPANPGELETFLNTLNKQ